MGIGYCIHHPDRPASARCPTCHKPVCADCVVRDGGNTFCSATCRDNYARFQARYKPEGGPGILARLKNFVVTVIVLALLAVLAVFAGAKFLHVGFCQDLLKRLGL